MELGRLEQEIYIEATPEFVYQIVSRPEHLSKWWVDAAEFEPEVGRPGELGWVNAQGEMAAPMLVVSAEPHRRFSFYWIAPPAPPVPRGTQLGPENAMLITFEIAPSGSGSILKVTEEGMRELGWEAAVLEQYLSSHGEGWQVLMPRVSAYAAEAAT